MQAETPAKGAFTWWGEQRGRYNLGLVVAGISAFMMYVAVLGIFSHRIPDAEVTLFTMAFQGIGYLFMMGVANLFYFAGPISEAIIRPSNVDGYRKICYRLGYWFSFGLPFLIPTLVAYFALFHPERWQ